jgi:hypothetical protein
MKILGVLLCFVLVSSCYESTRDCKNFKTGKFKSEVTIKGKTYTSTFSRTNTLQVETYNGKIDSTKVRWINDCEIIYTTINPKNRLEKKDIHLKILTTNKDYYTFEYSYVGETNKQQGTAIKINK